MLRLIFTLILVSLSNISYRYCLQIYEQFFINLPINKYKINYYLCCTTDERYIVVANKKPNNTDYVFGRDNTQ